MVTLSGGTAMKPLVSVMLSGPRSVAFPTEPESGSGYDQIGFSEPGSSGTGGVVTSTASPGMNSNSGFLVPIPGELRFIVAQL